MTFVKPAKITGYKPAELPEIINAFHACLWKSSCMLNLPIEKKAIFKSSFIPALAILFLLCAAYGMRLPHFTFDTEDGEVRNVLSVLEATRIRDISGQLAAQMQPIGDFLVRKLVGFQIFGYQERGPRWISVLYGMASVWIVFLAGYSFFLSQDERKRKFLALCSGLAAGAWLVSAPIHIKFTVSARSYAFAALLSFLWFHQAILKDDLTSKKTRILGLCLVNTHFFGIFPVGAASVVAVLREKNKIKQAAREALYLVLLIAITVYFNLPAIKVMLFTPPGLVHPTFVEAVSSGFSEWIKAWYTLAIPLPWFVMLGLLGISRDRARVFSWTMISLALLFVFIIVRMRSNYDVGDRQLFPYFGLGSTLTILAFSGLVRLFDQVRAKRFLLVPACIAWLWAFGVFGLIAPAVQSWSMPFPKPNFTPYFKIYSELKETRVPVFILHAYCFGTEIPVMYMKYIEPRYRYGYDIGDTVTCDFLGSDTRRRLKFFLDNNPKGIVAFDDKRRMCPDMQAPQGAWNGKLERIKSSPECVWMGRGLKTVDDVLQITRALNMSANERFLDVNRE